MILAVKYVPAMYATVWALVPPVVAIVLALITKEVYSSLFVGIVIGGLFYGNVFQAGFSPVHPLHPEYGHIPPGHFLWLSQPAGEILPSQMQGLLHI